MRGEDRCFRRRRRGRLGSPPHARGRHQGNRCADKIWGITPACAGKTPNESHTPTLSADHPRMRGEDWTLIVSIRVITGSPPHARGRQAGVRRCWPGIRITPACAGKTRRRVLDLKSEPGSPPHARGRLDGRVPQGGGDGITPACAGKTVRFPRESDKTNC